MANRVTKATSSDPSKRTKRTQESVEKVLGGVASGDDVVEALKRANVKKRTFYDWLAKDPKMQTAFADACRKGDVIKEATATQIAMDWATKGLVTKVKKTWVESKSSGDGPSEDGEEDGGGEDKADKVIVVKETTRNPNMLIQVLALKAKIRANQMAEGAGAADADIYKILGEAHDGLTT